MQVSYLAPEWADDMYAFYALTPEWLGSEYYRLYNEHLSVVVMDGLTCFSICKDTHQSTVVITVIPVPYRSPGFEVKFEKVVG